jgi:predicted RNA-binding Zn ribbon-like protein
MAMGKPQLGKQFLFVGNHPCLDFINTEIIQQGQPVDLLGSFEDLVAWLVQAQFLDVMEAKEAVGRWSGQREGMRLFEEVKGFRAALRAAVERIAMGGRVPPSALSAINELLSRRVGYTQLVRGRSGFEREHHSESNGADRLLVPLAEAASDLLCDADLSLIKRCRNASCILHFYDTTKNHARRWCSMSLCGNRMKVAAHYRRRRSSG